MESILDQLDGDLRKRLAGNSVRSMKLKILDKILEGHEGHALSTYIFWLVEVFIVDKPQAHLTKTKIRTATLQSWCDRLQNYGFEPLRIFDTLCASIPHLIRTNAVIRSLVEKITEEIRRLLFRIRNKKRRTLNKSLVEGNIAPPSFQYSDSHTIKTNDNEGDRRVKMVSNKTDISDTQKCDLIEISSDSDSELEILGFHQATPHQCLPPQNGVLLFDDSAPGPRSSERREQMSYDPKQKYSPYVDREPSSPPRMDAFTHGLNTRRGAITKQPSHITSTTKDSCMIYDGIYNGDDAAVNVDKQMQITLLEINKRRQDAEDQGEASKKEKYDNVANNTQEMPNGKTDKFSGGSETFNPQRSKRNQDQMKNSAKPHFEYLCYRCEIPGHFLQDCPTNLDPNFDKIPVGGYKCMICGKKMAHLTSLCPQNTDPQSLTQLRLKFGTVATGQLKGKDDYRPDFGKKVADEQQKRSEIFGGLDDGNMNEGRRRAIIELGEDDNDQDVDEQSLEPRYMRAKRAYSTQKSPQHEQVINRHASPPRKRVRHGDQKKAGGRARDRQSGWDSSWDREHLTRSVCPSSGGKSNEYYMDPSVRLASLNRPPADRGRLSYWDSEYQPPPIPNQNSPLKYGGPALSSSPIRTTKQPLAQEFWSEENRVREIKRLFPFADSGWVDDMVSFNADKFFEELDGLLDLITSAAQEATPCTDTITEYGNKSGYKPSSRSGIREG